MIYRKGDEIQFHNGDDILTGWVDSNQPVIDDKKKILGYMVHCPEFQGVVRVENIIENNK